MKVNNITVPRLKEYWEFPRIIRELLFKEGITLQVVKENEKRFDKN